MTHKPEDEEREEAVAKINQLLHEVSEQLTLKPG